MTEDEQEKREADERLARMPPEILRAAVACIRRHFAVQAFDEIRELHAEHGRGWVHFMTMTTIRPGVVLPRGHLDWGMRVRNLLREHVALDGALPFGHGWEDCYVEVVEVAVGLRPDPFAQEENWLWK